MKDLDAHRIAPRLWMGSFPDRAELAEQGVSVIALCADELQERQACWGPVEIIHAGIDDSILRVDEVALATKAAKLIAQYVRADRHVLVTCAQGRNRSGLVAAIALRELLGFSGSVALKRVRARRRVPGVLTNPYFERYLRGLPSKNVIPYTHALRAHALGAV